MLLAGLSTGHMIGLAAVAACFIGFAIFSSVVAPRRWPDFPGKRGLPIFIIASFVLFLAMLSAVVVFGVESEPAKGAAASSAPASAAGKTIQVQEKEFKILLPVTTVAAGKVSFVVKNIGKTQHDLAIAGPAVTGPKQTALINPGASATLTVTLGKGTYTLTCTVPGHAQLGMKATLKVS